MVELKKMLEQHYVVFFKSRLHSDYLLTVSFPGNGTLPGGTMNVIQQYLIRITLLIFLR
jgi:hypothetical protein